MAQQKSQPMGEAVTYVTSFFIGWNLICSVIDRKRALKIGYRMVTSVPWRGIVQILCNTKTGLVRKAILKNTSKYATSTGSYRHKQSYKHKQSKHNKTMCKFCWLYLYTVPFNLYFVQVALTQYGLKATHGITKRCHRWLWWRLVTYSAMNHSVNQKLNDFHLKKCTYSCRLQNRNPCPCLYVILSG